MSEMSRTFSRVNGWSLPPHPLQILAWLVVVFLIVITFSTVIPSSASAPAQIALYIIFALVILVTIIINVVVTTLDPADHSVRNKVKDGPRPYFDRQQHRHVIDENYYCNICETSIHPSSKHCRQCNKCILDFDHHCKWLNNCVGARNYKLFLIYVVATTVCSFLILILSLTIFVLNFAQPGLLTRINGNLTVFGAEVADAVWIVLVSLSIIISCVIFALTLHLLIFHLRLISKGLTTYNFIMQQKRETEQQQNQDEVRDNIADNASGIRSESKPNETKVISLFDKLKRCFSKKQTKGDNQENRISPQIQPNNNKFMQVSQKQKNQTRNDVLAMDDVSNNNFPSQEYEMKNGEIHNIYSNQPAVLNVDHSETYNAPSLKHRAGHLPPLNRGTTTNSNVPYEQVDVIKPDTSESTKTLDINSNLNSTVPHLPPIGITNLNASSTSRKRVSKIGDRVTSEGFVEIYEPLVETVFLNDSSKELTLPSITLDPPDNEHFTDEMLSEIPISAFNNKSPIFYPEVPEPTDDNIESSSMEVISTEVPGLYYASGQFTVSYRRPNIVTTDHVDLPKPNIWYAKHLNEETVSQNSTGSTISSRKVHFDV